MFFNNDLSLWAFGDALEAIQRGINSTASADFRVLDAMREQGYVVSDYYTANRQKYGDLGSRTYTFGELPKVWPLRLIPDVLHKALPSDWGAAMEASEFGFIFYDDINAMAWPSVGKIGLLVGIQNFMMTFCFASLSLDMYAHIFGREALEGLNLPPEAAELGARIEKAAAEYIFARSEDERVAAYTDFVHHRSILDRDYPDARPWIEREPTGVTNEIFSFIVLHELAHIILKHGDAAGAASRRQEQEADRLATEVALKVFEKVQLDPLSFALAMSFSEAFYRLKGKSIVDSLAGRDGDSHPQPHRRRADILEHFAARFRAANVPADTLNLNLAVKHYMHMKISALLLEHGYEPLLPFFSGLAVKYFGIPDVPGTVFSFPEYVQEIEALPFRPS